MPDAICSSIFIIADVVVVIGLIYLARRWNSKPRASSSDLTVASARSPASPDATGGAKGKPEQPCSNTGDSDSSSSIGSPAPSGTISSAKRRPEQVSIEIDMQQEPEPVQMLDQQRGFFPMRFMWRGDEYQVERLSRFGTLSDVSGRIMRYCLLVHSGKGTFKLHYDVEHQGWHTTLYSTMFLISGMSAASDIPAEYLPGPLRCSADSMRACRDELNLPADFMPIVWCEEIEQDIVAVTVPGGRVPEAWEAFRDAVPSTGRWPVLLGSCITLYRKRHWLRRTDRETPEQILANADAVDDESWREKLHWDMPVEGDLPSSEDLRGRRERAPFSGMGTGLEDDSIILLLPTRYGWQSAAYLNFGGTRGWNACPPACEHVAYNRYWHDKFGADVAFMAGDSVDMAVSNPPLTREALLELLCEQYSYCYDLYQTTRWFGEHAVSLEDVARDLLGVHWWKFWWD